MNSRYAQFPSLSLDLWDRFCSWAKLRSAIYSHDTQKFFAFAEQYRRAIPPHQPLHFILVNNGDKLGPDVVSFRYSHLRHLAINFSRPEELWTLEYYQDIDEIIEVPTEVHVCQALLRYTLDEAKFKEFLDIIDKLKLRRNLVTVDKNLSAIL